MRGLNKVIIAGNLSKDPDVRYTASKKAYASFTVAVNRSYRDTNGEFKESVEFVPVVVWGAQAESCGKFLKKGSQILIEGRFTTRSHDAKDGSGKRYFSEVNADNVFFLGSSQRSNDNFGNTGFSGSGMGMGFDDLPIDGGFGSPASDVSFGDASFGSSISERGFNPSNPDETATDIPF